MKSKMVKTDDVVQMIYDYWNQIGDTISTDAKDYLVEQVEMMSIEIDTE